MTAKIVLDRCYLETRCKIIELAANLDRLERGEGAKTIIDDPRLAAIRTALGVLLDARPGRAERCQMVFSLPHDESWQPPNAR